MLMLFVMVGCTNSGLGQTDALVSTQPLATPCPWVGEYDLTEVNCSLFAFDPWFDDHDDAVLRITQNDQDGWCDVEVELAGPDCAESEEMTFVGSEEDDGMVAVTYRGISNCEPAACVFGAGDDACTVGDGEGAADTFALSVDPDGVMELVDEQPDGAFVRTAPECTLNVVTRWTPRG